MTSAPINDFAVMPSYQSGKKSESAAFGQAEEVFGSFQNAMAQAKSGQDETVSESKSVSGIASAKSMKPYVSKTETAPANEADEAAKATDSVTEDVATKEATQEVETDETVKDAVEEATDEVTKDVVEEIAEELDVPEEQVIAAMEALGLTAVDLMEPSNMAALVTQLTGEGDPMAMLTDEGLYATIQQLTETVGEIVTAGADELAAEFDMEPEQVLNLMQEAAKAVEDVAVAEQEVVVEVEDAAEEVPVAKVVDVSDNDDKDMLTGTKIAETVETDTTANQNLSQSTTDSNADQANIAGQQVQQTQNAATIEKPVSETPFTSYVDVNEVINQIGEYVKIHRSEGLSEMEILLNPESLGNIHLQVASKEGVITATITTQNEAIQEALMVQALVLKEELNEQGLRVDAVEVAVASHGFERDMHEGGEEAKELFEKEMNRQTRRRLVVDGMMHAEELLADEDLTEAEKLQIDMMARSGNSVDFMA